MMRSTILATAAALTLLSGCTGLPGKINSRVDEGKLKATSLVKDVGQTESSGVVPASVVHENGMWIANNVLKQPSQGMLPPIFNEPAVFDRTVYSLTELAERITLRSGIPTKVTPDALQAAYRALNPSTAGSPSGGTSPAGATTGGAPPAAGTVLGPSTGSSPHSMRNQAIHIIYPGGTLKGLLDTAAARFGVFWKYANASIQFYYTDSRSFQINAIPGDSALNATVASGSTSGAAGGGGSGDQQSSVSANNSQNTNVTSQLSVFGSIEKSIKSMLTSYGQVVSSPATGTITVVDTPDTLDRVAQFVESENHALSRQVMINVTVLSVNVSNGDTLGINWNAVYTDLSRQFGIQNIVASANDVNSNWFSAAILNTASSKFAGSQLVINALARQGQVRRETSASVVTLNNQPVPVQVAKQTSYLRSSQTTITANVGTTTTLSPGVVTSGFNMTILPHVLKNGTVMLQFSTDMSTLVRIRQVASNTSSIETPEIDTRNFLQRVSMKSNETLIISGFEQTDDNLDRSGTGTPGNFLFGGGFSAQTGKDVIVILITPVTLGAI